MKVNKKTFLITLIFLFTEVILLAIFNANWVQHAPCDTPGSCPIIFSLVQVRMLWASSVIAVVYLGIIGLRIILKKRRNSN